MTRPYKLTQSQIHTLQITYKFRFITTHLLAEYRHLTSYTTAYQALAKLVEKKYLVKRLTQKDKADRKNAIYYLSAAGTRYLREEHHFSEDVLKLMSKNSYVGQPFLERHLELFKLFLIIRSQYPGVFDQYSMLESGVLFEDLIAKPDLYLSRIDEHTEPGEYFLYYITENQMFIIKRLLNKILADYNKAPEDEIFPTILLACPTASVERRICEYLRGLGLEDELQFMTSTMKALTGNRQPDAWTSYETDARLISL